MRARRISLIVIYVFPAYFIVINFFDYKEESVFMEKVKALRIEKMHVIIWWQLMSLAHDDP